MKINNIKHFLGILNKSTSYGTQLSKALTLVESHKLIQNPENEILFKLRVLEENCNILKTMHGGAIATLIDVSTTVAITGLDKDMRQNVSVELTTHYLNPIKSDTEILVLCKIPKIGKTLAYSYAEIYDNDTLKLLVNGNHIKAMLDKKF
jgi:acyl-coenzyme A thioesterase 13